MSKTICWLHLSDLHYAPFKTGWDANRVIKSLLKDLRRMQDEHGLLPNLIFFTGDAVYGQVGSGPGESIGEQFAGFANFLEQIRTAFSPEIPHENIFLVPGNHDINRDYVSEDQTEWLDKQYDVDKVISVIKDNRLMWKRYFERLHDYRSFLEKNGYAHLLQDPDRLIYCLPRQVGGATINVVGLNTVWTCSRDGEKGKIWMAGRWQIEHLLSSQGEADISVLLTHHPSSWLVEQEDPALGQQIERDFDFWLHGHEHSEWVTQVSKHVRIAAGACYDRSDKANGYNFVRLSLEEGTGEVWLRRYHSGGGGWIPEIIPDKTNNDGLWSIERVRKIEPLQKSHLSEGKTLIHIQPSGEGGEKKAFRKFSSDLPPIVDAWVGRIEELFTLGALSSGVAVITGIGGQGKSTLVSKFLQGWAGAHSWGFWDWRDCREEKERFLTQLTAVIEHLTNGEVTGDNLVGADAKSLVRYFFELAGDTHGIIVLDNIDSYVNEAENKFSLAVDVFVQEALRVKHNLIIILTCRPRVTYPSPRFTEVPLGGVTLDEALELFKLRGFKVNELNIKEVEEIWSLTEGHPLWLNLISGQMSRNPQTTPFILQELRQGHVGDNRVRSMFKTLWKGLNDRHRIILRCMSEITYPETQETIADITGSIIKTHNQFTRAFQSLKTLNLIVERGAAPNTRKYDLHPLVRSFIKTEFPTEIERRPYIKPFLLFLVQLITGRTEPSPEASLEDLQRWTAKAELELASKDYHSAIDTLARASDRLIGRGFHEEFFRVAKLILDQVNWHSIETKEAEGFYNTVVPLLISALIEHKREDEAREYLRRFEDSISGGADANTVLKLIYLKSASYLEWVVGNFDEAINIAEQGRSIRDESQVDTAYNLSITYALALRDNGRLDEALKIFAEDEKLEDLLLEDSKRSGRDANFYGNIGRCLQFKGEVEFALQFYVNAADLLQNDNRANSVLNAGYADLWIGEALESMDDYNAAYNFYRRAAKTWATRAPIRVSIPTAKLDKIRPHVSYSWVTADDSQVERFCNNWISDFRHRREKRNA